MSYPEGEQPTRKRFDGLPTPAEVERFYAPYTSISESEAEALAGKFKDTVIGDTMKVLLESNPTRIAVTDVIDELWERLRHAPDSISAWLMKTYQSKPYPDGVFCWDLYRGSKMVERGGNYLDAHRVWEKSGTEIPQDLKDAAFTTKKYIEKLVPGFRDSTKHDRVQVVFLPTLKEREYILEQELLEAVGTVHTRPDVFVDPQVGSFQFYQYGCIKGDRKSDLLFLSVGDRRGRHNRYRELEDVNTLWVIPDMPAFPNEYFHYPLRRTRYADSSYDDTSRTIYAPVPPELQHYFQ